MRRLLVHYNEIALKGKNRGFFEDRLIAGLRMALWGTGWKKVRRLYGRLLVEFEEDIGARWDEVRARVSRVFGVSHFARAVRTDLDIEAIRGALLESLKGEAFGAGRTFGIFAKRPNKRFPLNSLELCRELGNAVQSLTGWKVHLEDPDFPIYVYILEKDAYFSFDRAPGPGGLPLGTAGKVLCLISGGIDSPVAAARMMRRGCTADFIHFHSFPHTSAASIEKARELVECLLLHRGVAKLHLVPFAELQRKIVAQSPPPYRVLLYRRFMMRAAEALARRERALAIVTGESLGQVASQTLENISSIQKAVSIPVLRPLVGMDKLEIVREAEAIGTFAISTRPHEDCCGFLMPRNPATYSLPEELEAAEIPFDVDAEVKALLASTETQEVNGIPGARKSPEASAGEDAEMS